MNIDPHDIAALERVLDFAHDLMLEQGQDPAAEQPPAEAAPEPELPPLEDEFPPDDDGLELPASDEPEGPKRSTLKRYSFAGSGSGPAPREEKPQHKFQQKRRF